MTDADDPLLPFLRDEVERIEREVDALLSDPAGPGATTLRWTYRFTWQEVERARRYRQPLPNDAAVAARRLATGEARRPTLRMGAQRDVRVRYRDGLNAYQVTVTMSAASAG